MHRKLGKRTFCLNFCSSRCRHNSQSPSSWFSDRISILSCLFVVQLLPQRVSLNLRSSVFKTTKHLKFKIEAQNSRFFNFQNIIKKLSARCFHSASLYRIVSIHTSREVPQKLNVNKLQSFHTWAERSYRNVWALIWSHENKKMPKLSSFNILSTLSSILRNNVQRSIVFNHCVAAKMSQLQGF